MSRPLRSTLALLAVAIASLALAAVALAGAKPVKGATYSGKTTHEQEPITLTVSQSGKSVTASETFLPQYCEGGGSSTKQITKPAAISANGSFKAVISYEVTLEHRVTAKLYVSGKFSGHSVKGTVRSEFLLAKECDGSTAFSAKDGATAASAHAAAALHVTSDKWEVGEAETVHSVASGGKLEYCASQPVMGITAIVGYSHAPVGKSYQVKLTAPAASGSIPAGIKTKFKKASGRVSLTYAVPSFAGHKIAGGTYTFSLLVGGKTVASIALTLDPTQSLCS